MILKKPQEMGSDTIPNNTLSEATSRLSTVAGTEHSVWRSFGDTSETIDAIISEIEETVLARRLLFVGKETGAKLEIIASNRHLIEVLPPSPFTETDCIEAVLDCLCETFSGCKTLKTQVSERNPKLPETNHSFSLKMLRDTFEERKEASFFVPTLNSVAGEIRNMASAWLEAEANCGTLLDSSGPKDRIEFLEQKMNHLMVTVHQNSFRNFEAANLTLLPVDEVTMLALLQTQKTLLLALCPKDEKRNLIDVWRQFSSTLS